ncbi:RNA-directed DNA polymerase [Lampropedia puyangensis]|uniref:RNA-directed DNA polymerase n=1 Tax=Lampropedia puyangensis TaxID=1330072 RepID=A0A4S8F917_9BURK|nr:reverse transcriptase family protein [Lampropedia puyangensis]THU02764.1 RNA-directed DNA polymerase [Lampropedia puyangensis]
MRPFYDARPIGSLAALSKTLQVELSILQRTASNIEEHYHAHEIVKKSGGTREINIPSNHLKIIQKRINKHIFENVVYPSYLHGGLPEKDYVKNANCHSSAEVVIALDIKNFYPSISIDKVEEIFQFFCHFPKDVSKLLAELCCLNNSVPQGGCSSSHIANLILNNTEYSLVSWLSSKKYTYTRLLDDINISSKHLISKEEITKIIKKTKETISKSDLKLNNKKQKITSRSNPEILMEVTGLWLNRGTPKAHTYDRKLIRAEMHKCQTMAKKDRFSAEYHEIHNSISGKVAKLSYLKHKESERYRYILRGILPLFDKSKEVSIRKQANYLLKSKPNYRKKYVYFKKYHKLLYKLNILTRNNKSLANQIKGNLKSCKPLGMKDELLYNEPI